VPRRETWIEQERNTREWWVDEGTKGVKEERKGRKKER
jgi:hypothetical protein